MRALKITFLDIIANLIQRPGHMLVASEEFVDFLKTNLVRNIIESSTSDVPKIMSLSHTIFFHFIKNFRSSFQFEISVYVEDVILKLLDSVNNKPETKHSLIRVLPRSSSSSASSWSTQESSSISSSTTTAT